MGLGPGRGLAQRTRHWGRAGAATWEGRGRVGWSLVGAVTRARARMGRGRDRAGSEMGEWWVPGRYRDGLGKAGGPVPGATGDMCYKRALAELGRGPGRYQSEPVLRWGLGGIR